jgi:hypothetical protein
MYEIPFHFREVLAYILSNISFNKGKFFLLYEVNSSLVQLKLNKSLLKSLKNSQLNLKEFLFYQSFLTKIIIVLKTSQLSFLMKIYFEIASEKYSI